MPRQVDGLLSRADRKPFDYGALRTSVTADISVNICDTHVSSDKCVGFTSGAASIISVIWGAPWEL